MRKHTKTVPSEKSKDTAIARKGENVRSGFRGRGISLLFAELCFEQADEGRNQRQHENRNDDQLEMLLHGRNAAEEVEI